MHGLHDDRCFPVYNKLNVPFPKVVGQRKTQLEEVISGLVPLAGALGTIA